MFKVYSQRTDVDINLQIKNKQDVGSFLLPSKVARHMDILSLLLDLLSSNGTVQILHTDQRQSSLTISLEKKETELCFLMFSALLLLFSK